MDNKELNEELENNLDATANDESQSAEPQSGLSEVDELQEQLRISQDKYLRLYSDFDNFRKRTQKEKSDLINYAAGDVMKDLLDLLDDFGRAVQANESNNDIDSIKEGLALLYNKFDLVLKNKGLIEMDCLNNDFDPEFHEAITNIDAGEEMRGKVVDVIQKGYVLKERVIRYAKVVVGQ